MIIDQGSTSEVLKDMITIFYEPLAKVYKAANIADSLYDLQAFITDLIKTVEQAEEGMYLSDVFIGSLELIASKNDKTANLDNPQLTVQTFVDLVARHEARFYNFVHQVHSKGEGLFDNLMKWIELFVDFMRAGLPSPVSLEFLLPHSGKERQQVMKEVDEIIEYNRKLKLAHHDRTKRRLLKGGESSTEDVDAAFLTGVMENFQLGSVMDDVNELAGEDSDEEEEEAEERDDSEDDLFEPVPESSPTAPKPLPLLPGQLVPIPKPTRKKRDRLVIDPPKLVHIPLALPVFVELVREQLQDAYRTR